ncbi:unnamed protein product, partial [Symbiodinium necroappetens]
MTDEPYDLLADWEEMRQRHAQECFAFVRIHQERCLKMYDEEVSCEALQRKLGDKVVAWLAQHGYNDAGIVESMVHKSKQFVDSLVRLERPKVQNRIDKDKELKQKRDQALLDATCKWESLDVKDVLSPALLELARQRRVTGETSHQDYFKCSAVANSEAKAQAVTAAGTCDGQISLEASSYVYSQGEPFTFQVARHIPSHQKCTFIIRALELVMDACVVSFNGKVYESQDGVATGLGVAGQVANIYLSSLDNFLMQSCDNCLQFLRRYIDDLLLLWSGSALELSAIANSWHPSLKFDLSGDGNVHFLDVALHIEQNKNSSAVDVKRSLAAFKLRLRDRGFSIAAFERIVKRYQDRIAAKQRDRNMVRQVFLKVPFNK